MFLKYFEEPLNLFVCMSHLFSFEKFPERRLHEGLPCQVEIIIGGFPEHGTPF
jgi:hypothetical protein